MSTTSTQRRRSAKKNSRQAAIEGVNEGLEVQAVLEDSDSLSEGTEKFTVGEGLEPSIQESETIAPGSPPETGDYVYGQTTGGKTVLGFAQSVGRQYLKLMDGQVHKMESVQVLQHLPKSLELFADWVGNSLTEQLDHLFEEYAFYNLSRWVVSEASLVHLLDYKGWSIDFYKTTEANISKHEQTWYLELNKMPELKDNEDILEYCREAIDHAEGVLATIAEYEQQAISAGAELISSLESQDQSLTSAMSAASANPVAVAEESQTVHAEVVDLSESDRHIEVLYQKVKQAESSANDAFRYVTGVYLELGIELNSRRPEFRRGTWLPWLAERGIEERYAQRAMQIARHLGDGEKSDSLSDFSLEQALRQVQKRLPSVDGYTFDEVQAEYNAIKPDCFKHHHGAQHPYTFEIQGFTACFDSLTQAMNRLPSIREKYGRIANYQSVDALPEPALEPIAESEVEQVTHSGWIQTRDGRNLNPRHYEVVPAPPPDAIAQVLEASEFIRQEPDEVTPDSNLQTYRDWKVCTESPNGGMLAVSVQTPQGQWWSYPTDRAIGETRFGYEDWSEAMNWARCVINEAIDAHHKALGQLDLLPDLSLPECKKAVDASAAVEPSPLKVLAAEFCQAHGVADVAIAVLELATFDQLDELGDWICERQNELERKQRDENGAVTCIVNTLMSLPMGNVSFKNILKSADAPTLESAIAKMEKTPTGNASRLKAVKTQLKKLEKVVQSA